MCLQDIAISRNAEIRITTIAAATGEKFRVPANPMRIAVAVYDNSQTYQQLGVYNPSKSVHCPLGYGDGGTIPYATRPLTIQDFPGLVSAELYTMNTSSGSPWQLLEVVLPAAVDLAAQALLLPGR